MARAGGPAAGWDGLRSRRGFGRRPGAPGGAVKRTSRSTLRAAGWLLAAVGSLDLLAGGRLLRSARWRASARSWVRQEWPAILVLGAVAAGLTGSALAPATDADSLNYHLGVPLDWLRNGGGLSSAGLAARSSGGLGESANLLGLAAGTDNLGAGLQLAGLALSCLAVGDLAELARRSCSPSSLSPPARNAVSRAQSKTATASRRCADSGARRARARPGPPSRATIAARPRMRRFRDRIASTPFLLSGAVLLLTILIVARRNGQLRFAIAAAGVAMAAFAAPLYARNALFYGDPLSPFLEGFLSGPDAAVVAFADRATTVGWREGHRSAAGSADDPRRADGAWKAR